jgi:hypothetical protein
VKKIAGIGGVSQVWADRPEWYIWVNHAPGAYALALEDTDALKRSDALWDVGQFALKCYPYPSHPVYDSFTAEEKQLVTSQLFDHTHTPRIETRVQIPETLFRVGGITLMVNRELNASWLTFESLDQLRVAQRARQHPEDLTGRVENQIVRNVPGWQTGWPFFNSLVSLFAFHRKQHPRFIAATRSPGIEQRLDRSGHAAYRPNKKLQHLSMSLMFCDQTASASTIHRIWRSGLEPDEEIIFEHEFCKPGDQNFFIDAGRFFPINAMWWKLAKAQYRSEMATTCGCSDALHIQSKF